MIDRVTLARDDLCLAFVNTLAWRGSAAPVEALRDAAALLDWIASARPVAHHLRLRLRRHREAATALLCFAVALRETLARIFARCATGAPLPARDLAALNRALAAAPARARLASTGSGGAWCVAPIGAGISSRRGSSPLRSSSFGPALLAPVLWSAGDLLAGPARGRVRCCANPECLWLFLDQSKGGTRRWCDMASCGNRAKARRHYLKTRGLKTRGLKTRGPRGMPARATAARKGPSGHRPPGHGGSSEL
jgi:predicted RNA-binding Zn ribbon-like protein